MQLSESDVQVIVDELRNLKLLQEQTGFGSRVVKYKHRFCNTEFGDLKLTRQQLAIVCVLLLRGPQTPGELRTRTNRLADFSSVDEVESTLENLTEHNGEALVAKLPREPGKRESRYVHLFTDEPVESFIGAQADAVQAPERVVNHDAMDRIAALENDVSALKAELAELKALLL